MKRRIPTALFVSVVLAWALAAACASLLGVRKANVRAFEHRAHVVRGISCVQCHTSVARSDAAAPVDLPGTSTCLGCHSEPHDQRPCGTCHGREEDRHAVIQAKEHLSFSHASHGEAVTKSCTRCHGSVVQRDGPLRPPMATCLSCHEHREEWSARKCVPCHTNLEDEHVRPASHVVHGESFMERHGVAAASSRDLCSSCHAESECLLCHGTNVPALPQTLHFEDPHRPDMHGEGFFARHAIEARIDPATCTSCHRDASDCRDCHERRGLLEVTPVRGNPHPPGWVGTTENLHGAEARRNPMSCASCHGGAGETLCVGCHREGAPGGNPHPPGFSTSKPASEMPCRMCHAGEPR